MSHRLDFLTIERILDRKTATVLKAYANVHALFASKLGFLKICWGFLESLEFLELLSDSWDSSNFLEFLKCSWDIRGSGGVLMEFLGIC